MGTSVRGACAEHHALVAKYYVMDNASIRLQIIVIVVQMVIVAFKVQKSLITQKILILLAQNARVARFVLVDRAMLHA